MSESQYYEFAAIDRPLTEADMAPLRKVSTRGQISASGLVMLAVLAFKKSLFAGLLAGLRRSGAPSPGP